MIRPFEDRDAEAAAALIGENTPWLTTAAGLRHRLATLPPRAHRANWVADRDGVLAGWAEAEFDWTAARGDVGRAWTIVSPGDRRRGLGSELFERAVAHVLERGARELRSWSFSAGDAFLERRGFERARVERLSAVDPRTVDTSRLDAAHVGVQVVSLASLDEQLRDVFEVFRESIADMPSDHPETNLAYDEWVRESLGDPDLSREGSAVALVDGRPASLSWVHVDHERGLAQQEMTGTARAYRRRGLARLAKLAVIRWAAESGIVRITTGNDATNAPMLAINEALGFRPFAVEAEWVKELA